MNRSWATNFAMFALGVGFSATSLHAQVGQEAIAPSGSGTEVTTILAGMLVLVIAVVLGVVLFKRSAANSGPRFEDTQLDDEPITYQPRRKEPSFHTTKAVHDKRTDTVIAPTDIPPNFDVPKFLRKSKAAFVRLQASWDNADLKDLRRFMTKELFGEFCNQLKEREGAPNRTEVLSLEAELQGIETVGEYYIATVLFSGTVKEDNDASAKPFSEEWKLSKPLDGHRSWIVAGIQQY